MPVRLSRPASKAARSNHRHEFRPTGDALLRAGEYQLGQVISKALAALSRTIATDFIEGRINQIEFVELTVESLEPYREEIDRALYRIALDEARDMSARIRKTINGELRRLGSPVRLVMPATIRKASVVDLEWHTVHDFGPNVAAVEAFSQADPTLPMRVATRNQTTGILSRIAASEQDTIMAQIGRGFTDSQTFSTGRTVVGRTVEQTARSIVPILQEVAGTTMALGPGELAVYRSQYTNGLFPRWAGAVNNYADAQAGSLASQGITGQRALDVVDKRTAKYSNKLRRSRARMIARTETSIAQNQAMLGVMKDAQRQGLVSTRAKKQWVTGPFDVCKICEGLNGVKVPINQSFPGIGRAHPPAHPNCRCIVELVPDYSRSPEPVGTGVPTDPFRYRFPDGFEAPINPIAG
jgi:SPP1 gp7 family putative phage head morphogenesis protein